MKDAKEREEERERRARCTETTVFWSCKRVSNYAAAETRKQKTPRQEARVLIITSVDRANYAERGEGATKKEVIKNLVSSPPPPMMRHFFAYTRMKVLLHSLRTAAAATAVARRKLGETSGSANNKEALARAES